MATAFFRAALLAGAIVLGGIADRFIYYPAPVPRGWSPAAHGLEAAEWCAFRSGDGVALTALWIPRADARATILFLHGNGGNLTNCAPVVARLCARVRASALVLDYRGYGRSGGRPSEEGLYRDAEAAYDHIVAEHGARPGSIILYGHSLGTGVATELALRRRAAGLVLEAPFTSIPEVVQTSLPFLDAKKVLDERYDNIGKAPRLALPLLVVHGTADRTIPFWMGRAVAAAAPEPKTFLEVPGAGHVDCWRVGGARYYEAVGALVDRALGRRVARF
jgi:hypothetical protein